MAYSGTIGTTVITVQDLIDHAARRAGKLAEEVTSELQISAQQSLFFILSNLINQGINYWAINKEVTGLIAGQYEYNLPIGGNDVLNCLYRTMTRPTGTWTASVLPAQAYVVADGDLSTTFSFSSNQYVQVDYGSGNAQAITSFGIYAPSTQNLAVTWTISASNDGSTFTTLYLYNYLTENNPLVPGQWFFRDLDPQTAYRYFRLTATSSTSLTVGELFLGLNPTEITMSRLNRDDYTNLPNKGFTANQPYQFWFNRTIPQAKLTLWPVPQNSFVQMTVWYSRQVMDVGYLTGELEIPQRWYMAIVNMLAHQLAQEMTGVDLQRIQYLEAQAEKYFQMAEQEERDKSPIYFAPNIAVYTR